MSLLTEPAGGSPAPSDPPASAPWIGDDGNFAEDWQARLPEDLRGEKSLAVYKNLAGLAKSHVELRKMAGKPIQAPGDDATPDQIASWRKLLGAPDKPEAYGALRPESVPAEVWGEMGKVEDALRGVFHKHHAPPGLVRELSAVYGEMLSGQVAEAQANSAAELEASRAALQKDWGADMPRKLSVVATFAKQIGLEPTHPMFADAAVVKALYQATVLKGEAKLLQNGTPGGAGDIQAQIDDIVNLASGSRLSADYHGKNGSERQAQAQKMLRDLRSSLPTK